MDALIGELLRRVKSLEEERELTEEEAEIIKG